MKVMMILLALPLAALAAPMTECKNAQMIGFTEGYPAGMTNRLKPETGCYYDLAGTTPFQKTASGYLLAPVPGLYMKHGYVPVWLQTTQDIPQDSLIQGHAVYTGPHTYQGLNGFTQTVHGFKLAQ
jgi:hypothetical protein